MTRSVPPVELLVDVKQTATEFKHVIIGTFSFDAAFFERRLLPILQHRDAENILVLMDKREYEEKFSDMKRAGKDYYVDYCRCRQIFHPKFSLFIWSSGAKLSIGSANMTDDAWMTSGELVLNIEYDSERPDRLAAEVLEQMRDYLLGLIERGLLRSTKHRQKLREAIEDLANLIAKSSGRTVSTANRAGDAYCKLLHNLDEPIFSQLRKEVGNDHFSRTIILAPFFDPTGNIIDKLLEMPCDEIHILVQKDKVVGFPQDKIKRLKQARKKIRVFTINFREISEQKRFIHAKLLVLEGKKRSYCLFGSANATAAALLSTVDTGNAELCVLRKENNAEYFDYLLQPTLEMKEINPEDVVVTAYPDLKASTSNIEVLLTDARLEKNNLVIEFEPPVPYNNAKLSLFHEEAAPKELNIRQKDQGSTAGINTVVVQLNPDAFSYCSSPTYVSIIFQTDGGGVQSDKRWISTQALETVLRRRTVDEIEQSNGRFGLIEFLNQLEEHFEAEDWFLYYLQAIDFESLGDSLNYIRGRLPRLQTAEEDKEEQEVTAFEERPEFDARQVMKKIIGRHQRKLHERIEYIEFDQKFDVVFSDIFNLFMFVNKIILWFVFSGRADIAEFRLIRDNIEKLAQFASESMLDTKRRKIIQPLLSKLQFWEHLVILSNILFKYHKSTGYSMDKNNQGVVTVFMQTYLAAINAWGKIEYGSTELVSLDKASEEYKELKAIELKADDVTYFCDLVTRIMK